MPFLFLNRSLFNNVMEIRVDSFKLVQLYRMPPPSFPTNIGIWSNVFGMIAFLSGEQHYRRRT